MSKQVKISDKISDKEYWDRVVFIMRHLRKEVELLEKESGKKFKMIGGPIDGPFGKEGHYELIVKRKKNNY